MTELNALLREARERGNEPHLVDALEKLIAELGLVQEGASAAALCERWGVPDMKHAHLWKEPTGVDWMRINGHRWATDRAILFRHDAPRPLCRRDEDFDGGLTQASARLLAKAEVAGTWPEELPVYHARFARLLRECPAKPCGHLGMGVCRQGGEVVAVVVPIRSGSGVGPDGEVAHVIELKAAS